MSSDVTAVVPTVGESTLAECLAALEGQSLPPDEIIVIENVSPFVEAMNQGIRKVRTRYLLQCDADMILDPDCIATLRSAMTDKAAVTVGYLDDLLLGTIQAVKLFRTSLLRESPFSDSIASDSDRIQEMRDDGHWMTFARRQAPAYGHAADVLGNHRPNYDDPVYTYGKFSVMGSIVRSRNSFEEFQGVLQALKASDHPRADFALIAFSHGLFNEQERCAHVAYEATEDCRFLCDFVQSKESDNRLFAITKLDGFDAAEELARIQQE